MIGWEKKETKRLDEARAKELKKTRSSKKKGMINSKYDLLLERTKTLAKKKLKGKSLTRKLASEGTTQTIEKLRTL